MAFSSSKITAITGATGAQGPAGNDGQDGAAGPQGPAGTMDLTADQSWTGSQRATIVTDNDGSFDLNAGQNFKCTPTGIVNLTFTNEADGQSGYILLVNGSAYAHTKDDTTVKAPSGLLTDIGAAGTFLISYFSDGTTTYLTNSKALS